MPIGDKNSPSRNETAKTAQIRTIKESSNSLSSFYSQTKSNEYVGKRVINEKSKNKSKKHLGNSRGHVVDREELSNQSDNYESINESSSLRSRSSIAKLDSRYYWYIEKWKNSKTLYSNIQLVFLLLNLLTTLILVGLAIWINIDYKFRIIYKMGSLAYTSFHIVFGFFNLAALILAAVSLFADLSQTFLYFYVRKFLDSHDETQLKKILLNQKRLNDDLSKNALEDQSETLELRIKIRRSLRSVLASIKVLTLMSTLTYVLLIIGVKYFFGLFLHFNFPQILSYQLPQTLMKIIKEYEKQQMDLLSRQQTQFINVKHVNTETVEEKLVNEINALFKCCNYQNPYQFGDLAPLSCTYNQGCLKPMQDFLWYYLYITVIVLLSAASFKFCLQLVLLVNFKILLLNRLLYKLYYFDESKLRRLDLLSSLNKPIKPKTSKSPPKSPQKSPQPSPVMPVKQSSKEKNKKSFLEKKSTQIKVKSNQKELEEEEDDDEETKREKDLLLKEIRRNKEIQLQLEEEEEEKEKARKERETLQQIEQERRQIEYEQMLAQQNRFEELKEQQMLRKQQLLHFFNREKDNSEDV
jgi:hypothetical protein